MRLIDADALIKAIDGNPFTTDSVKSYIRVSVAKMPTIEERKGHWIFRYGDWKYKQCSECGREYYSIPSNSRFCPKCGARMEVKE